MASKMELPLEMIRLGIEHGRFLCMGALGKAEEFDNGVAIPELEEKQSEILQFFGMKPTDVITITSEELTMSAEERFMFAIHFYQVAKRLSDEGMGSEDSAEEWANSAD